MSVLFGVSSIGNVESLANIRITFFRTGRCRTTILAMNTEKSLEEFLRDVATRDACQVLGHTYVFPKDDVGERLKLEIARKTGCKPTQLPEEAAELLLSNRFLSARPEKFVSDTIQRTTEAVKALKRERAKSFDLMFANPYPREPHWGDQVQLRIRFAS